MNWILYTILFFMRIIFLFTTLMFLASCSLGFNTEKNTPNWSGSVSGDSVAKVTPTEAKDGTLVSLHYTLRESSKDGKILETTRREVAEKNGILATWSLYEPFQVLLWSNSVIVGFEKGLIGMKKWEKKVIEVSPELGYGTGPVMQTLEKYKIAPIFTVEQDKKAFEKTITQTISRNDLPEDMKNATLGQTLTGANGSTAKVTTATSESLTLEIENTENPFYNKKLVVWASAESPNGTASFKVLKISGTGVTLEVTNKESPFYNKKFAIGEKLDTPQWKIMISEISDDTVTIAQEHPMMGKTLFFDVEIMDLQ